MTKQRHTVKEGVEAAQAAHAGSDQHYTTPVSFAVRSLEFLQGQWPLSGSYHWREPKRILDAGCGNLGAWGWAARYIWPNAKIIGVDVRDVPQWSWYDKVYPNQSLFDFHDGPFDAVIGNPPFGLAQQFVLHALRLLKANGFSWYVLPGSFLESKKRIPFFAKYKPYPYFLTKRPSWWLYDGLRPGTKKTNHRMYAMYFFGKGYYLNHYDWLTWDYDESIETQFNVDIGLGK